MLQFMQSQIGYNNVWHSKQRKSNENVPSTLGKGELRHTGRFACTRFDNGSSPELSGLTFMTQCVPLSTLSLSHTASGNQHLSHANMLGALRIPPSVSPPPTTMMGQRTPANKLCLGIASQNSGSILSYLASSFRKSASQLDSMALGNDLGVEKFNKPTFSGNANVVAPHGNMIAKKMVDGKGYKFFPTNCLGTTDFKHQIVRQCSSCAQRSTIGNRFMNHHHNPVFVPHGTRTKIDIIVSKPDQATQDNLNENGQSEVSLYVTGDISTQFDNSTYL